MKHFFRLIVLSATCFVFTTCGVSPNKPSDKLTMTTSIPPIKHLVERIVEDDFNINVIVPNGTSPETYTMSPRQSVEMENSRIIFITGVLDLEHNVINNQNLAERTVNLSHGIDLIDGCSPHTHHDNEEHTLHSSDNHHAQNHTHGIDPHIWLSTRELSIMATNIRDAILAIYPDSIRYAQNAEVLLEELSQLHKETADKISDSGKESFMIYHPALSYYAREFGINQISVEVEGKEPNVEELMNVINLAKRHNINTILYQNEFSDIVVKSVAEDIDAEIVCINPLCEDILSEISMITNVIIK